MKTETNSHIKYSTISHEHLDDLVNWATDEYPSSGLMLVECSDGRWFIEIDYGHDYDSFSGISKPKCVPTKEPIFYSSKEKALCVAIDLIKQIHKNISDQKISEYFSEDCQKV